MDGVDTGLAIGKDVSVNIGENGAHLLTFSILADEVILPARQIGARA
jgi:hypothetical protein